MFSSIKWKFVLVYFLLVFIAMVIVGIFIVGKLETQQIDNITDTMEKHIETIIGTSSYIAEDDWLSVQDEIQETLNEWRLDSTEILYVIHNKDVPTIIASSSKQYERVIGQGALSHISLDPILILQAFNGELVSGVQDELNENTSTNHIAYPVLDGVGKVKGVMYMVSDLKNVIVTVNESRKILVNATFIALLITISLGFFIASSITEPIRDVTKKAEEMAQGDFEQFVEVKSDDEIGQLASMFNYLTLKLKDTIYEMDLERSKLDTIFNYMAEGVVAVDTKGYIIHANPIAIDILNMFSEDEYEIESKEAKKYPLELVNLQNIDYEDKDSLEGDETLNINSQVYKVKYAPFKNEKDYIGGLILVFQDMTNEHKLDNMRKEFVANVSHELKTPITTIKSYAETLKDSDVDKDTETMFLNVIDDECDRMSRLVSDLLQLSNLDYKKTIWRKERVSINNLIEDIVLKLDFQYKEKNQSLHLDLEEDLPGLLIDQDGIEQVISNIFSNAIKYTPQGGKIEIFTRMDKEDFSIKISDNGVGIPDEDQKRIFERFYRVEKGRSRDSGGTGLGLAIARQIIEAHGGELGLESTFGQGTSVEIRLPKSLV